MISAIAVEKPSVAWPAAKVEIWPIERLTADPRNARVHGPEQIEQIRASLREFGWTMPVLVRENGMLIAGHGRLEGARLEGIAEVPTIVARGWTEAQCQASERAPAIAPGTVCGCQESASASALFTCCRPGGRL